MVITSSWDTSIEFEVFADVKTTDDYITFDVVANVNVDQEDPAYSPKSGNSMTARWTPNLSICLDEVNVTWSEDTDELGDILKRNKLKECTLIFSCDGYSEQVEITVSEEKADDILVTYKDYIQDICKHMADHKVDKEIDPNDYD